MHGTGNPYYRIPMSRREAEPGERIFILKIIQSNRAGKVRGYPYRILAIPEYITLFEFAGEICRAFRFGFDHMFGFYDNLKIFYESTEGYELFDDEPETMYGKIRPEFDGVVRTPVNRAFREAGKKMLSSSITKTKGISGSSSPRSLTQNPGGGIPGSFSLKGKPAPSMAARMTKPDGKSPGIALLFTHAFKSDHSYNGDNRWTRLPCSVNMNRSINRSIG